MSAVRPCVYCSESDVNGFARVVHPILPLCLHHDIRRLEQGVTASDLDLVAANGRCDQAGCLRPSVGRFTWPGKPEARICEFHIPKLYAVAEAVGLKLEIRRPS
jgi:hypothetical protein